MNDKILLPDADLRHLGIKTMKNKEAPLSPGNTRPETYIHPYRIGYVIFSGGIGDFVAYLRALEWLADTTPHLYGTIFLPGFMTVFAQHIFADRPHWKIESNDPCVDQNWHPGFPILDPGRNGRVQFLTAHGAHPIELGFAYYANMRSIPPEYDNYPEIDLDSEDLPNGLIPGKYAVFAPAAIVESRTVPGHFWNPIVDHIKSLGLVPVVLGKGKITDTYLAKIAAGMNMDGIVNLFDQTTILQAARIIQYAAVTIGLDNGLLHLAGATTCPIVFGYNVTNVQLRRPRRRKGKIVDVFLTKRELGCSGCLTDIKAHPLHNFDFCLYKSIDNLPHPKCIDMLFDENGKRWKTAIDLALQEEK